MNPIAIIKSVPGVISKMGGKKLLVLKKYAPEILTAAGVVGGVTSGVLACKATLKVDKVMDKHEADMDYIHDAEMHNGDYNVKKETAIAYAQTAGRLAKLYAPAVSLGVASTACVLSGFGIIKKRNVAITAAYSVVQGKLSEYRKRVVDELGEEKDREFYHGLAKTKITVEETEDGKTKKVKKEVHVADPNGLSMYAKFFDDSSPMWRNDSGQNLLFLQCQQNFANDKLHTTGHVFLNEVYDALGIPRTKEGAIVGWVEGSGGDDFIDFGIHSIHNQEARDFVNGYNDAILLDFNVDGIIWDLI